ncbi:DUF2218 domain-containing protein [Microbulbifer sp. TRSA002]|uniref:DUF2218 domain-containing protein n=1 Tax=Microbulbifer sp. TRSA002 TaxID=3243382 RepID=UPI004039B2C6
MSTINKVEAEHDRQFLAFSTVIHIDSERMIRRLCKHFAHKVNAHWSSECGHIEFDMGFCDMNGSGDQLDLCCGANSDAELKEIIDCIDSHFLRFAKGVECSLQWNLMNS